MEMETETDKMLELIDQDKEESDDEAEDDSDDEKEDETLIANNKKDKEDDEENSDNDDDAPSISALHRSERIRDGIRKPGRYAMVMRKLMDTVTENYAQKQGLEKAKVDDIKLVFKELKAMEPVKKEDIPKGYKAHNMHLFTVEKFAADGCHDKYKSRLVAHGNEQDSIIYADWSSPMVATQFLRTCPRVVNPSSGLGGLEGRQKMSVRHSVSLSVRPSVCLSRAPWPGSPVPSLQSPVLFCSPLS